MTENETNQIHSEPEEVEIAEAEIVEPELGEEAETPEAGVSAESLEDERLEEISVLQGELAEARAQADEYLDGWQRARAEFANYKKRVEREQAQTYQMAAGEIIKRYLGILDDLERAIKDRPQEGDGAAWANGIELIYSKFVSILDSEGVTPIQVEGQSFDPNLHEAISADESDQHESGEIIEALQQGYMLGERVLRPAVVRVAR
jgi:molecular chaperone GrpE